MTRRSFLFWAPRILGIIFLSFLTLLSLDVFSVEGTFTQRITGFFIHNIPMLILLGIFIISWKYELVGTIVFFLAALMYMGMTFGHLSGEGMILTWVVVAGPAILMSILFFLSWREKKKKGLKKT